MKLYLVRHGAAFSSEENPDRPLTDQGKRDVDRLASFLARSGVRVPRVIHSGILRAEQTAIALSTVIGPGMIVEKGTSLSGNDDIGDLIRLVESLNDDLLVVGHAPHIPRVAAALLNSGSDENVQAIQFDAGAICCIERVQDGGPWRLVWHLQPSLMGV